ncbi:hypothetical protein GX48_05293 [Paracoccidioides brasiliensis]|nr:hypothetical protein GX48_05293 [Paracoccidioides brasiliensis]
MALIADITTHYDPFRMPLSRNPSTGPATESAGPKRHAACDECSNSHISIFPMYLEVFVFANDSETPGQRKLKCSGEADGCSRCVRQNLYCHYSIQKPMGRPPKSRVRRDEELTAAAATTPPQFYSGIEQSPPFSLPDPSHLLSGAALHAPTYSSYTISAGQFVTTGPMYGEHGHAHTSGQLSASLYPTLPAYPQTSGAGMLSPPLSTTFSPAPSLMQSPDAFRQHQPLAPCSCVSYMYLCLNSLSTLSSFPPSSQTLFTLYSAARNARSVIYCEICPQSFSSSVQNLMVLGSLLNVLGDTWLKVSQMDAEQLGRDVISPSFIASLSSDPNERKRKWKRWLNHVIRHAIIGSAVTPMVDAVQSESLEGPNLLSLIEELEDRQRWWHSQPRPDHLEFHMGGIRQPHNCPPGESAQAHDTEHLCTRIASNARRVIDRFAFDDEEMMG